MRNLKTMTDEELVALYAIGNNPAFDVLLNRHKSSVHSYIYYIVRDRDLTEDIFQDTFMKAIVTIKQGRYTGSSSRSASSGTSSGTSTRSTSSSNSYSSGSSRSSSSGSFSSGSSGGGFSGGSSSGGGGGSSRSSSGGGGGGRR